MLKMTFKKIVKMVYNLNFAWFKLNFILTIFIPINLYLYITSLYTLYVSYISFINLICILYTYIFFIKSSILLATSLPSFAAQATVDVVPIRSPPAKMLVPLIL